MVVVGKSSRNPRERRNWKLSCRPPQFPFCGGEIWSCPSLNWSNAPPARTSDRSFRNWKCGAPTGVRQPANSTNPSFLSSFQPGWRRRQRPAAGGGALRAQVRKNAKKTRLCAKIRKEGKKGGRRFIVRGNLAVTLSLSLSLSAARCGGRIGRQRSLQVRSREGGGGTGCKKGSFRKLKLGEGEGGGGRVPLPTFVDIRHIVAAAVLRNGAEIRSLLQVGRTTYWIKTKV